MHFICEFLSQGSLWLINSTRLVVAVCLDGEEGDDINICIFYAIRKLYVQIYLNVLWTCFQEISYRTL